MPKDGKDPQGGLTAKGRAFFARTEGAHLRPGVKGVADTPDKMVRKGSFLRRHFTHPRGPMQDEHGQPTRLALSAHAWGEPIPRTMADAKKLAKKGHELLERYHAIQDEKAAKSSKPKASAVKASPVKAAKKQAAKKAVASKPKGSSTSAKKASSKVQADSAAKKAAPKKAAVKARSKRAETTTARKAGEGIVATPRKARTADKPKKA